MFLENKYTKWYKEIISQAKTNVNNNEIYTEKHHIIPRCLGGDSSTNNLVRLTAREHFICHLLLTKMHSKPGLGIALCRMMSDTRNNKPRYLPKSSKIYAYAKEQASISKRGANNPMWGKTYNQTEETKQKISDVLRASTRLKESRSSKEYREKISDVQSEETLLVSVKTNQIVSSWKNCRVLADALNCTYANIKNARRDKRPIGRRLKTVLSEECFVIYQKDF